MYYFILKPDKFVEYLQNIIGSLSYIIICIYNSDIVDMRSEWFMNEMPTYTYQYIPDL